jgi:hypothetical protein
MPMYAIPVKRGCGTRAEGGVYAELGFAGPGEDGVPLESFLLDPAAPIPAGLDVPAQGALQVTKDGVSHLFCHVGSVNYPNVVDWIEEARRFGISWRLPMNLDFSALSERSLIFLSHARAFVKNHADYPDWSCRWDNDHLAARGDACSGIWWTDVEASGSDAMHDIHAEPVTWDDLPQGQCATVVRHMPSFQYTALTRRKGVVPSYEERIFAVISIGRLVVVRAEDGSHVATLDKVRRSGLNVEEVYE